MSWLPEDVIRFHLALLRVRNLDTSIVSVRTICCLLSALSGSDVYRREGLRDLIEGGQLWVGLDACIFVAWVALLGIINERRS